MKILFLILAIFAISCSTIVESPDRDVASQEQEEDQKEERMRPFEHRQGTYR